MSTSLVRELMEEIFWVQRLWSREMDVIKSFNSEDLWEEGKPSAGNGSSYMGAPTWRTWRCYGDYSYGSQLWINIKMTENPNKKHEFIHK